MKNKREETSVSLGKPNQQNGKSRKPIRTHKRLRVFGALVVFVLLTAALVDFRNLMPHRIGHELASVQLVPAAMALGTGALVSGLAALVVLLVTLLFGRVYCSVLCPLGIFQDLVFRMAALFKRKPLPFSGRKTLLRQIFFWAVLAAIPFGWGAFALSLLDPYSNYGRIAALVFRPLLTLANNSVVGVANAVGIESLYRVPLYWAGFGALLLPGAFLTFVVLMSALRGRLYCNSICPVGTLLGWVARRAAFRLEIDKDACVKCGSCFKACKAQCIDLRKGEIDFDRCVACYNCIGSCDEHGIHYRFMWGKPKQEKQDSSSKAAPRVRDPQRRAFLASGASALALTAALTTEAKAAEQALGKGKPRNLAIAPPGAQSVERFLERCTACQLCVSACPSHVLQPSLFEYGPKGFMKPRLDFNSFYCDFDCRRCAEVCPDGAISLLELPDKQVSQIGVAELNLDHCIVAVQGTDCAACSEHCPTKAVYTVPFGENLRCPEVNPALCIGCGACEYACPAEPKKAIRVRGLAVHGRASKHAEEKVAQPSAPAGDFPF